MRIGKLMLAAAMMLSFQSANAGEKIGKQSAPVLVSEQSGIVRLDEKNIIVCSTYRTIQITYAQLVAGINEDLSGCWAVDAPIEVIVLQGGQRYSSITYRKYNGDDVIARMVANGAPKDVIDRVREDPWTPWYQSPAWTLTGWLVPEQN